MFYNQIPVENVKDTIWLFTVTSVLHNWVPWFMRNWAYIEHNVEIGRHIFSLLPEAKLSVMKQVAFYHLLHTVVHLIAYMFIFEIHVL